MKSVYLYVTPFFPSPSNWRGGFSYDAVRALERTGRYRVIVLKPDIGHDYDYRGVRVHTFRRLSLPFGLAPFLFSGINSFLFRRKIRSLGISVSDIAVCHGHTMDCVIYPLALKKDAPGVKTVWQTHQMGSPFNLVSGRLGVVPIHADFLYSFYRRNLMAYDVLILLSQLHVRQFGFAYPNGPLRPAVDIRMQTLLGRVHRKVKPKKYYVFYNGIDTTVFYPAPKRVAGRFLIGCVANFGASKDQMTLLRAFNRLIVSGYTKTPQGCELHLEFVGAGQQLNACRKYVFDNKLESRVVFRTEVDHHELPDIYRTYDLFVLPTWQEGFCCTLVEAAGCGVPIMSCRGVSIEEVISKEVWDKWLFYPKDDAQLARLIRRYCEEGGTFRFNQSLDIDVLWEQYLNFLIKS